MDPISGLLRGISGLGTEPKSCLRDPIGPGPGLNPDPICPRDPNSGLCFGTDPKSCLIGPKSDDIGGSIGPKPDGIGGLEENSVSPGTDPKRPIFKVKTIISF